MTNQCFRNCENHWIILEWNFTKTLRGVGKNCVRFFTPKTVQIGNVIEEVIELTKQLNLEVMTFKSGWIPIIRR